MNTEDALQRSCLDVLVADDERISRTMLARMVEKWGHQVRAVENGDEALEQLRTSPPHVLITDWEMPGADGPRLCAAARSCDNTRYIYVIMLTQHQEPSYVVEGLASGADDFVVKPFNPLILKARLGVAARIVQLEAELRERKSELEMLNLALEEQANTDPLMGIGNRRSFDETLSVWCERAARLDFPFGLLMADVDFFKAYNDNYGHQAGDQALASVAKAVRSSLRGEDRVFRYGGEEIAVLLSRCASEDLIGAAERLRGAVEQLGIAHEYSPRGLLTISIGAASTALPTRTVSPEVIIGRADDALYEAKSEGRNLVRLAAGDAAALCRQNVGCNV